MAGSFVAGQGQLKKIRAVFPPGDAPRLGSDEALRRVERIDLSFGAWAKELASKPRTVAAVLGRQSQ